MTKAEREVLIELYGNAYEQLSSALGTFPQQMWNWKPAPEKWSIHEIVVHLADSEANSYVRCRRFIAEPGSGVYGYNENKWATGLAYGSQHLDSALELFKLLRRVNYELIKTVSEVQWETATVIHSESGKMGFEEWLKIYTEHVPVHMRQMQRNFDAWAAIQKAS